MVRWTRRARRRLDQIGARISEDNPAAAARVVAAIARGVQQLASAPGRGRPGRIRGTRELIVVGTPYTVAYRVHENDIEVLTIQHGAQLWPEML
ncbi:MAG: type II toxin-antitoxin system mRNA interferase toxin, RelE/StbE family [Proteobacteria bacterium]|nr:type II toxin-antitoxin system mRNA interferase toxin, RelE/StbE family [Pseudomonadota bacterium]